MTTADISDLDARAVRASVDLVAGADYAIAAELLIAAFVEPGVLERGFSLPEIIPGVEFPAAQAISFHFIDYVVHSWDVAKTLGVDVTFDPPLLDVALTVAQAVPGGKARLGPGAAFGPRIEWSGGTRLDEIVAILGRSPDWHPVADT